MTGNKLEANAKDGFLRGSFLFSRDGVLEKTDKSFGNKE